MAKKKAFLLRVSPEMWVELNRWAKDELRSVNAQIEFVLRAALRAQGRHRSDDSEDSEETDTT